MFAENPIMKFTSDKVFRILLPVVLSFLLFTTACKGKKDISELLVRKWDLSNLKLSGSVLEKRKRAPGKIHQASYGFEERMRELSAEAWRYSLWTEIYKDSFPFIHDWKNDESFIKFYKDGTFTQQLPYVFLHGTWAYDADKSLVELKLWEGSRETLHIDFINEDSFSVKVKFDLAKSSKLEKYLYMDFDNCELQFRKDWYFYSSKLTDPFSSTSLKWLIPPMSSPSEEEVKTRVKSFLYYKEKLMEQRDVNQHEMYTEERFAPFEFGTLDEWSRRPFDACNPWCLLFYDEAGYEKFCNYWNSVEIPYDSRPPLRGTAKEKFESYSALRKIFNGN